MRPCVAVDGFTWGFLKIKVDVKGCKILILINYNL